MSVIKALLLATFLSVGFMTSAGAAPFPARSLPAPLNVIVPVPIDDGVPAVPPATSAPGTVMA